MGKLDDILHKLKITTSKGENNVLNNLIKIPPKEHNRTMPHTTASKIWAREQCDTLYLPDDDGYKYALVVVDLATRKMDAEAMKFRNSHTAKITLEKIFRRGIVKKPLGLEVDAGTEFQGEFEKHFSKIFDIITKESGRHRQQSVVETKNQQIGKILNARMLAEEINNDATSRSWVDILPQVVKLINQHYSHPAEHPDASLPIKPADKNKVEQILEIGTPVRVKLDNPVGYVEGQKLHGKFRTGDIRWTKEIKKITRFYLRPNSPVMYEVNGNNNVAYTRHQLQIVSPDEVKPNTEGQRRHYAQEIVGKKTVKGRVLYQVRWEDGDLTEETPKKVKEQMGELLKEYNKKN